MIRLRVCVAASGGGHLRQLLDIKDVWSCHDYFVLTEDSALGKSFEREHPTVFVPHFALGQARLGHPLRMLWRAAKSCVQSFKAIRKHRPQLLITTGAGSTFFAVIWARLFGAKIILLDSMARVHAPSKFALIAGPLAHLKISQSIASARLWDGAIGFETIRDAGPYEGQKEAITFATVGATLPFERLTNLVIGAKGQGLITDDLILQVGDAPCPDGPFQSTQNLTFDEVNAILKRARTVICHGGTGSLVTALKAGCHVIAVPRRFDRGEHYDNHQAEITQALADLGFVTIVDTPEEMAQALAAIGDRPPIVIERDMDPILKYMSSAIETWFPATQVSAGEEPVLMREKAGLM